MKVTYFFGFILLYKCSFRWDFVLCLKKKSRQNKIPIVMMRIRRNQSWLYLRRCGLESAEEENTNAAAGNLRLHRYMKVSETFLDVYWYHSIMNIRCWCPSFLKILINGVRFIMSPKTAGQSHKHPASSGSSHDSSHAQGNGRSGCGIKDASSITLRVSTYLAKCYRTEKVGNIENTNILPQITPPCFQVSVIFNLLWWKTL